MTFNGQIYGVPYALENIALYRNTDLAPTAPATMEDLVTTGEALKAAGKVTEMLALPVGPKRRRVPRVPDLHLGRRVGLRQDRGRQLRPQAAGAGQPEAASPR